MEAEFWRERWRSGRIGFHQAAPNGMLTAHLDALGLAPGARVFAPLCGKTRDVGWLLWRGFRVVGVELSEIAVADLFRELGVDPDVAPAGALSRWRAPGLDVLLGDVFAVDAEALGPVDAVYDRAALIALPPEARARYAAHGAAIAACAPQLLVTLDYDPAAMDGPPFPVDGAEVSRLYGDVYAVRPLSDRPTSIRDGVAVLESAWLLTPCPRG
jgi:thiopurine S-methyltransferase